MGTDFIRSGQYRIKYYAPINSGSTKSYMIRPTMTKIDEIKIVTASAGLWVKSLTDVKLMQIFMLAHLVIGNVQTYGFKFKSATINLCPKIYRNKILGLHYQASKIFYLV